MDIYLVVSYVNRHACVCMRTSPVGTPATWLFRSLSVLDDDDGDDGDDDDDDVEDDGDGDGLYAHVSLSYLPPGPPCDHPRSRGPPQRGRPQEDRLVRRC